MAHLSRREFTGLVAAATICPLTLHAQPGQRLRRVGVLASLAEDDPEMKLRLADFRRGLERRGWSDGHNIRLEVRSTAGSADRFQPLAKELVESQPDAILAHSTPAAAALQRETRSIPIVFVAVSDPIGSGFIASLAQPAGNLTGVLFYEATIAGKWLGLLKEIAPHVTRVAVIANPKSTPFDYFVQSSKAAAASLRIDIVPSPAETAGEIEQMLDGFARVPNGGLFFPPDSTTLLHRDLIVERAARHRLPAVYPAGLFVAAGGLVSYATDRADIFRLGAFYVDRILRGAKPADLPVQAPTRYETVINLKTAKALGLSIPAGILVAADEVIE